MKNYSKNMWQYLSDAGVLDGTINEVEIKKAKIAWRRHYKKEWRKNAKKNKELRPCFTPSEFEAIVNRAKLYSQNPTSYARDLILSAQQDFNLIPRKSDLMNILQALSMSAIALQKDANSIEAQALVFQAESMLLRYLNVNQ